VTELLSPLRYPGSKQNLADYFENLVNENLLVGAHLYELYAGGASISLRLLSRELISGATLIERDPLIYSFWKCVKCCPEDLCARIEGAEVTLKSWKRFQCYLAPDALRKYSTLELGLACLFLNRSSFSGVLGAGPIGGMAQESDYKIDCRFNKDRIIASIGAIGKYRKKLRVVYGDALTYLRRNGEAIASRHSLVYLDPPYVKQGKKLYRFSYEEEDHKALADLILKEEMPWVVSYDNHPLVRKIFAGQRIMPISLNYVVKQSRRAEELLIANVKLSKPIYETKMTKAEKVRSGIKLSAKLLNSGC
jgi:DNA adenine methylase